MNKKLYNNSLSLVMFGLFLVCLVGQTFAGFHVYNDDQEDHHQPQIGLVKYLGSGHFIEAVFENWESEFLQMGSFVVLTIFLYQKGSSESKKKEEEKTEADKAKDNEPKDPKRAPWPVRRGGLALKLYENSLSLALFALFFATFALHVVGGAMTYNEEQRAHHQPTVSPIGYLGTSQLWFESFQNWQSEFLSVGALAVLSIFLRQKGSPESKRVDAANDETAEDEE